LTIIIVDLKLLKKIVKKCLKAGINCPFPLTFTNNNENKCKTSVKMDSEHRHSDKIRYSMVMIEMLSYHWQMRRIEDVHEG
jgi:hypothetical protein